MENTPPSLCILPGFCLAFPQQSGWLSKPLLLVPIQPLLPGLRSVDKGKPVILSQSNVLFFSVMPWIGVETPFEQ